MKTLKFLLLGLLTLTVIGCGAYSFTGASIPADVKTFQVNYFQNNARIIEPGLERDFTLALQDLINNQTSLDLVTANADLVYEGEIIEYRISPTTATADNTAAQNRLTIGINVRFFDRKDDTKDFEQPFSFFYDYEGTSQLTGNQKEIAIQEIFERLTQDVFNASLADW